MDRGQGSGVVLLSPLFLLLGGSEAKYDSGMQFNTASNEELAFAYSEILPPNAAELMGLRKSLERIRSGLSKAPHMGWSQFGSLMGREFEESQYSSNK
jgi:hypothetical protein